MDVFHLQNADMVRVDIDAEISGLNHKKVFLGMGRNPVSIQKGIRDKVLADGAVLGQEDDHARKLLAGSDLIVLAMYPSGLLPFIETYRDSFSKGTIVIDICGLKGAFVDKAQALMPEGVEYIGTHPMAGRETSGYDAANSELFLGTSFLIAVMVVVIGCAAGILIGSLCGYYGGIADLILMRICDTITAFPAILLSLVIISIAGSSESNIVLALGILFIPSFARVVRTQYAGIRDLNYIKAARLEGVRTPRILYAHILPKRESRTPEPLACL